MPRSGSSSAGASSIVVRRSPSACAWQEPLLPPRSLEVDRRRVEHRLDALAEPAEAAAPDEDDAVGRRGLRRRPDARAGAAADVDHREAVALREPLLHEHPQSVGLFAAGGDKSRKDLQALAECRRHAPPVITYVARRVLYSVPVLFVSTFLSFVFVSYAGDPTSNLRQNPQFSAITLAHLRHRYHLDEPVVVRYWYWLQDVFTHKLGSSLVTSQPIWPDIQRTLGHTGQVVLFAEIFALTLGHRRGDVLGGPAVLTLRLLLHDPELHGSRHAGLLAGAAPADPLRRHLPQVARSDLLHLGAEQHGLGDLVVRSAPAHRAPGGDDLPRQLRALQPLHARRDARRHQLGLRAHRAGERESRRRA